MLRHHRRRLHYLTPYRLLHPALLVWGFMLRAALGGWRKGGTSPPEALLHDCRNLIIAVWAIISNNMVRVRLAIIISSSFRTQLCFKVVDISIFSRSMGAQVSW